MTGPAATPPFRHRTGARRELLLLCDHAGNAVPEELGTLGLSPRELEQHVAWDPGAAGVTEAMAACLSAPAFFGVYSRLVVDLNRAPEAGDLVVAENDGVTVHGNLPLPDAERARRLQAYHHPYHLAIQSHLVALEAIGIQPALVAVHSFTPVLNGVPRRCSLGLLWKRREAWIDPLLAALRRQGLDPVENEPYDGRAALGYTLERGALQRGLRHLLFEIRHDLIATPKDQGEWGERLAAALRESGFPGA